MLDSQCCHYPDCKQDHLIDVSTPIPQPAALSLVALAGLGVLRRRSR